MPRRNYPPLPPRDGLGATRARVPEDPLDGLDSRVPTAFDFVRHLVFTQRHRHPDDDDNAVLARFFAGEVVLIDCTPLTPDTPVAPGTDVFFYRRPAPETPVPYEIEEVYEDADIMVVRKPPFLATMPRAAHITESATVRLRRATGNEELTPAHRLDRMTSGLLLFTKHRNIRGAYQELFARREVHKEYEAVAKHAGLSPPLEWKHHIVKRPGEIAAHIAHDREPNAHTIVRSITRIPRPPQGEANADYAIYLLEPITGKTHQLRIQMNAAGVPILGDPVYPITAPFGDEDFAYPMYLASVALSFIDPLTQRPREFTIDGFPELH
ncbi:pseudouridine synthase [Corynebacterium aquatimens]|uniref:RNA pseudouridylate synthase n=1 Tax=Corynebacterium aquatimens TaxID=1190508 RepID=A0A931E392_9CORY|nr:pseudouridine synthase [Corynebacterium aquatimens]MBG6122800.1 tRNA pseudouridine32 synthase/23S rRNA pseudouridine746 synthase [Corynebacterium aquatimens]WJY66865.1 Ribosomal large subunit pseudouridine synthase A [Corynebacterium aquatimens]